MSIADNFINGRYIANYEARTVSVRLYESLFLSYSNYPFFNKEKTLNQISNNVFNDTTNKDLFIIENNDNKNLVFVNSLWTKCVLDFAWSWYEAFTPGLRNLEKLDLFQYSEIEKIVSEYNETKDESLLKQGKFKQKVAYFVDVLIKKLDELVETIHNINSIVDICSFNEVCQLAEPNYEADFKDFLPNGNLYKETKETLLNIKQNPNERAMDRMIETMFDFTNAFYKKIEFVCSCVFCTLKVQKHFFAMGLAMCNNYKNEIEQAINNQDLETLLIKTNLWSILAEEKYRRDTSNITIIQNEQMDNPNTWLELVKNEATLPDIELSNIFNEDDIYDDTDLTSIRKRLQALAKYSLISNGRFNGLLKMFGARFTGFNSIYEDNNWTKLAYKNDADDLALFQTFSANRNILNNDGGLLLVDKVLNMQAVAVRRAERLKDDVIQNIKFKNWLNNNQAQTNFSYLADAYLINIMPEDNNYLFCYTLRLSKQTTRDLLLFLNEVYVCLWKLNFRRCYKTVARTILDNEHWLPEKWKYNANNNYEQEQNNKQFKR